MAENAAESTADRSNTDHAGVPVPPPLVYGGFLAAAYIFERVIPLPEWSGAIAFSVSAALCILGLWLILFAGGLFYRQRTSVMPVRPTSTLVFNGPYRFTRNPMYVGMLAIYLGLGILLSTAWSLLLAPLVVFSITRLAIEREERYLLRRFGAAYAAYCARVRRWI